MLRARGCIRVLPLLALLVSAPRPAQAFWSNDVTVGTPIAAGAGDVFMPALIEDGVGGVFVLWADTRTGAYDIYGQHFDAMGRELWTPGGKAIVGGPEFQYLPAAILDGAGGLIVTWSQVDDIITNNVNAFASRVNAAGNTVWGPVTLCALPDGQGATVMAPDGAGGAIVAWVDRRNGIAFDLYAQRITGAGGVLWAANGVPIRTSTGDVVTCRMVADGAGGAWIAWVDPRSGTNDIYAERVRWTGAVTFGFDGLLVCGAAGSQSGLVMTTDGEGGALAAWTDGRGADLDVYGQRLTGGGESWTPGGVPIIDFSGPQSGPTIVPDGDGGMLVAWTDARTANLEVRAQRIARWGYRMWEADGVMLDNFGAQVPFAVPDDAGGMIAVYDDFGDPSASLFAQRVDGSGVVQWPAGGRPMTRGPGDQMYPVVASDGRGGVIAVWEDYRNGSGQPDLWGGRVEAFGYAGVPEPVVASVADVPNDQGGRVRVSWHASWPEMHPTNAIDYYNVFRMVPAGVAVIRRAAGLRVVGMDGACESGDCLLVTSNGAETLFWEWVGQQGAYDLPGYSMVVATTSDSVAGSNPYTRFLVQARSYGATPFWSSPADSGYSTDDLAPAAPSPFDGVYAGGSTLMQWGANDEPDVAGYRLYRGTNPGFVPGPGSFVAEVAGLEYSDAAGSPFVYKLAAVDAHGNVGPYATLIPDGTLDAEADLPRAIALAPVTPNPSAGAAAFRFALPAEAGVRLAIHDAKGRAVRVLADGTWPAGEHTQRWDGRDATGAYAAAGVYLVRLETGGRSWLRRFVRMR